MPRGKCQQELLHLELVEAVLVYQLVLYLQRIHLLDALRQFADAGDAVQVHQAHHLGKHAGKWRSIISKLQRNTRSATSAYFSTPPSRSIIIMRSATSVGDSGRAFTLFTVGTANLTPLCSSFRFAVRPPSSNGFIGVRRQRTLKPVSGASGYQKATEKSVRSSVFASRSKILTASRKASKPSVTSTSSPETFFSRCRTNSAASPKSSRGNAVPPSRPEQTNRPSRQFR